MKPTQSAPDQHTPVLDDRSATIAELHARAAADYTAAEARREQLSGEDRVNGQQTGGGR